MHILNEVIKILKIENFGDSFKFYVLDWNYPLIFFLPFHTNVDFITYTNHNNKFLWLIEMPFIFTSSSFKTIIRFL